VPRSGGSRATARLRHAPANSRCPRPRAALVSTAPRSTAYAFGRATSRLRTGPRRRCAPRVPGSRVSKAPSRDHRRVRTLAATGAIDRGDETPRAPARGYRSGSWLLRPGPLQPDVSLRPGPISGRLPSGDLNQSRTRTPRGFHRYKMPSG